MLGGTNYLIYSANPANDVRGGLDYDFKQYNTSYGQAIAGTGNGFIYSVAPIINVALTGSTSKVYDGNTQASLNNNNYVISGILDNDTITISHTSSEYADKNAGSNKLVTVSGIAIDNVTDDTGAAVYGYQLGSTTANGNIGEITSAPSTPIIPTETIVNVHDSAKNMLDDKKTASSVEYGLIAAKITMSELLKKILNTLILPTSLTINNKLIGLPTLTLPGKITNTSTSTNSNTTATSNSGSTNTQSTSSNTTSNPTQTQTQTGSILTDIKSSTSTTNTTTTQPPVKAVTSSPTTPVRTRQ